MLNIIPDKNTTIIAPNSVVLNKLNKGEDSVGSFHVHSITKAIRSSTLTPSSASTVRKTPLTSSSSPSQVSVSVPAPTSTQISSSSTSIRPSHNDYIKYDTLDHKFKFKNSGNKLIGSFSAEDVILYIGSFYDSKGDISNKYIDDNKIYLIKKYICVVNFNNRINYAKIKLHDYTTSGFMGDIEMLVLFNQDLEYYINHNLGSVLNSISQEYRDDVKAIIDKFVIGILNYTISIIPKINNKNKDANEYLDKLKLRLLRVTNEKLQYLESRQDALYEIVNKSIILKKNIEKRICDLCDMINQNDISIEIDDDKIDTAVNGLFN